MKQIKGLILLLLLGIYFSINGQYPKTKDSLIVFLKTQPKDSNYVLAINEYVTFIIQEGKFTEGLKYILQMENISTQLNFGTGFYKATNLKGVIEYTKQNPKAALVYFEKCNEIIKKYKLSKKIHQNSLNNISIIYDQLGNREKATQYAMELIDFQEKNKLFPLKSSPYDQIGDNLKFNGKYEEALVYFKKALEIETNQKNIVSMGIGENKLGVLYESMGNKNEALRRFQSALKLAEQADYKLFIAEILINLGRIYRDKKQYKIAENYLMKSVGLLRELDSKKSLQEAVKGLANIYWAEKKYPETEKLLLESAEITKKIEDHDFIFKANDDLALFYAETGDFKKAYQYKTIAESAKDSTYNISVAKNTEEMLRKYEADKKQQEIVILNQKNEKASFQNRSLFAGLGLLGLALGLLFWNFQTKRKANKTINDKNVVLEKLNTDLQEANQTKAKLFGIISHDLRSPISQVYQFLRLQQLNPDLLSADQKTDLSGKIQTATGSLLETMEDLLLWSKTQMNEFNVKIQSTEIKPVIEQCVQLLKLNIEAKNLIIENKVNENISQETDPYFLQIIVRNLLQNAIKASPESRKIVIEFENNELSIQNEGEIFTHNQYELAISSNQKQETLSGLGLKLVDELSQKIGAKVGYEAVGERTCVRLRF